jgi:sugar phosphate permease
MISPEFLRRNARLLGFGFFMCFLSSAGQTFFISLYGGEIRASFGLTHGEFGSVYSIATLSSAAVLMWAGGLIDRIDLARYSTGVVLGLAMACCLVWGTYHLAMLFACIFCLRLFGQGLASHAAITTMGRYFRAARGRSISIASLGHTAGEAVLPALVVTSLALVAWRDVWLIAAGVLVFSIPMMRWLLRGRLATRTDSGPTEHRDVAEVDDWTLRQALSDFGLWLRMPAVLAPPFIYTGLIFHQIHIADQKGWSLAELASAYTLYAVTAVAATIAGGILVDRLSARRLVPVFLAPLMLACVTLAVVEVAPGIFAFMGLLGVSSGFALIMLGALWPELYGTRHLGSIKAFAQSAMVFGTGLAPGVMGLLIDAGYTIEFIAVAAAIYCLAASALAAVAGRGPRSPEGAQA